MTTTLTQRLTFAAIGTQWEIDLFDDIEPSELRRIDRLIQQRIEVFDATYSRFRDDSLIMRAAKRPGRYVFPDDAWPLFDMYARLYEATNGKVTPLIGGLLSDAGYDAAYTLEPKVRLEPVAQLGDVMRFQDHTLTLTQPAILDVGAAGKGYLIDIVGQLLSSEGIDNYLIDAGGDMLHRRQDAIPVSIGLEHPNDPSQVVGVVHLNHESICGSAGNRRAWAGLHHIMDPDTAEPVRDVLAVWAVADTAMLADGLATALFFTPAGRLQEAFSFEYFLIRSDMSYERSNGLNADIFGAGDE